MTMTTTAKIKKWFDFDWLKKTELVELHEVDCSQDPVRPELDIKFRTSHGRKIYGLKHGEDIMAVMCFAFTNQVPKTVEEMDALSKDAAMQAVHRAGVQGSIAIAYTVWSLKKGGGKMIVKEVKKLCSMSQNEIHDWHWSMQDILEHNRNHLVNIYKDEPLTKNFITFFHKRSK